FDVARDLVAPILAEIACEHLGLTEVDDKPRFFNAQMHMVDHGSHGDDDVQNDFDEAWASIVRVVHERRAEPRDDVISALTQWEPPFTDEQIHMMIMNV